MTTPGEIQAPPGTRLTEGEQRRVKNLKDVWSIDDLPPAIDGVIQLEDGITYELKSSLDLNGAYLQCGESNAVIR